MIKKLLNSFHALYRVIRIIVVNFDDLELPLNIKIFPPNFFSSVSSLNETILGGQTLKK